MPSLLLYTTAADLDRVLTELNADDEIAFVVADGASWRAVERVPKLGAGRMLLWHRPGGPLPQVSSSVGGVPFFGSIPAIVTLDVPEFGAGPLARIPITAFGWIGDRYKSTGQPAAKATSAWWRRLQRWAAEVGTPVARPGMPKGRASMAYALPDAQRQLQNGTPGEVNPPSS